MDFANRITELAARIPAQMAHIETEEATKTALILPFLSALGYDVFDPQEIVPEFTADIGTKKGEKVDYAIKRDGRVVMLIEAKWCGADLDQSHASQLYRYFGVTESRFGILTNGVEYRFFSDLEEPNKMDSKPFLVFDMRGYTDNQIKELRKFGKEGFDLDSILSTASELMYVNGMKQAIADLMGDPDDDFVKYLGSKVSSRKRFTQGLLDQFRPMVKKALLQFVSERVSDRLQTALKDEKDEKEELEAAAEAEAPPTDGVVTTEDEREAYHIVRALVGAIVGVERVGMRDCKTYCSVLLDENNRRPVCRLWFNQAKRYIGLFDGDTEDRVPISCANDIYKLEDRLKATALKHTKA